MAERVVSSGPRADFDLTIAVRHFGTETFVESLSANKLNSRRFNIQRFRDFVRSVTCVRKLSRDFCEWLDFDCVHLTMLPVESLRYDLNFLVLINYLFQLNSFEKVPFQVYSLIIYVKVVR